MLRCFQERNIVDFTDALLMESAAVQRLISYVKMDESTGLKLNWTEFRNHHMSIVRDPFFQSILMALYKNIIGNTGLDSGDD